MRPTGRVCVEVSGLALTGKDAHSYLLSSTAVTTSSDVTPAKTGDVTTTTQVH